MGHEDSGVIKTHPLMDSQSIGVLGKGQNLKGDASLEEVALWVCALEEDVSFVFPLSVFFYPALSPSLIGYQEVGISTKPVLPEAPPHSEAAQPAGWRLKTETVSQDQTFLSLSGFSLVICHSNRKTTGSRIRIRV